MTIDALGTILITVHFLKQILSFKLIQNYTKSGIYNCSLETQLPYHLYSIKLSKTNFPFYQSLNYNELKNTRGKKQINVNNV